MISLQDCIAFCGLREDEVQGIAEHEHLPEVAAAALANYLLHKAGGASQIRRMLIEDIRSALDTGNLDHASKLLMALRHFLTEHSTVDAGQEVNPAREVQTPHNSWTSL